MPLSVSTYRGLLPLLLLIAAVPAMAGSPAGAPPAPPSEQTSTPDESEGLATLDVIVVSGAQPGPGLWKVSRDGRVLWVLGVLSPLPKRMEWNTLEVEDRIAASGVVLLPPTVSVTAKGAKLGGIFLLPSLLSARNNPGKEKLEEVLPPADYARWQRLKAMHMGRDRGVEKRRPILAAMALRDKALDAHDLDERNIVREAVTRIAKRADVPVERAEIGLVVEDAKAALKEFGSRPLDDIDCFRRTLDQVENDLDTLAQRANAWAMGDLAQLRALTYTDNAKACTDALLQSGLGQSRGFDELPAKVQAAWLADAEKALATHPESFALLSMSQVLGPSGYLAALRDKGYVVESPEDLAAAAEAEKAAPGSDPAADPDMPAAPRETVER
jgi:uncharacterized protein YbaP (TraB family)